MATCSLCPRAATRSTFVQFLNHAASGSWTTATLSRAALEEVFGISTHKRGWLRGSTLWFAIIPPKCNELIANKVEANICINA